MTYPSPVMRLQELKKMGFPEKLLRDAHQTPGQTFAWKMNPSASNRNSPIVFDTDGFEKWRVNRCKAENAGIRRK